MKSFKYYISSFLLIGAAAMTFSSCSDDNLGKTIFPDTDEKLDPASATYKLDKWCIENYRTPYNMEFLYKMKDISTNMNYNLVPADYAKARDLALLCKYLWIDAYKTVAQDHDQFLKANAPRVIHVIGSPAYQNNQIMVGLAEGGVKISLYNINNLDVSNAEALNELCFHTMHHEFTHVLHQKKTYPNTFNLLSNTKYDASTWASRNSGEMRSLGFVTPYAASAYREDFAEVTSTYICSDDATWAKILDDAKRGWEQEPMTKKWFTYFFYKNNKAAEGSRSLAAENEVIDYITPDSDTVKVKCDPITKRVLYPAAANLEYYKTTAKVIKQDDGTFLDANGRRVDGDGYFLDESNSRIAIPLLVYDIEDKDEVDGPSIITQKLDIIKGWFMDSWKIDLDALRQEVLKREKDYDINALRQEIENIQ